MVTSRSASSPRLTALMRRSGRVCGVAVIEDFGLAASQVHGGPPDRLFQAGSISKPVTALAALELAERLAAPAARPHVRPGRLVLPGLPAGR
jgi:CubicO group peptidase (beta-lactamase class C family)